MKVHYSRCPVCDSSSISPILTVKDYTVSGEKFVIWQCTHCTLRFTQDVPDQQSIGPYYQSTDYISHSNISKGLLNQLYLKIRKHTLNQKAQLIISNTSAKGKLLDIGAGVGAFVDTMKGKGWEGTGIEPDAGARTRAKSLFQLELLDTIALENLPKSSFDAITLWHVLEHVHHLHHYIDQLRSLLTPGGRLFIAVPNYGSLDSSIYTLYWAAYDVPRHLYHFTPGSMNILMEKHGMKIIAKKPMWFDSFYISLLSSKYKNGKTNWFSAGINGLRSNLKALLNKDACSSLIYIISKEAG